MEKSSQRTRPRILDKFANMGEQAYLDLTMAKEAGKKVAGYYCLFAPEELIRAAGAVPVPLCGKNEEPIQAAEEVLPSNLCPLIKSSYGYIITDSCPFFNASDLVLGVSTCDGKKKMFELVKEFKPVYMMHLPYAADDPDALAFWRREINKAARFFAGWTGIPVTDENLREQILLVNKRRRLLKKLTRICADHPVPISGGDMLLAVEKASFGIDIEAFNRDVSILTEELEALKESGNSVCSPKEPRILITGCPMGKGTDKVLNLVEESGGVVVCLENCVGIKGFDRTVDETGDPLDALAKFYLETPCSCMSPNRGRMELLKRIVKEYHIDAVIDMTLQCCITYNIEAHLVEKLIEDECDLPLLHLDTGYSPSDTEQLRVRIQAFMEIAAD
ncbi:MAG: 2-hydroxyacyl-CoA dehydratase [Desulfobacterales bacterium]|nr:2-hydroxyacyl-CoA dehydratase [Desulfobacterales bacterium]